MEIAPPVSLEEYLSMSYDPDVEYVDGVLEERNIGDWLHSLTQSNVIYALSRKYPRFYALPALRSNTAPTRYRLPDITVLLSRPTTDYLLEPAHIVIEILSDDDRMTKVLEKLAEYESKGVLHIWIVDPRLKLMSEYHSGDLKHVETFRAGDIELSSDEVFLE